MSRYLGPRLRITRRLGHLSGLTRKKPSFKPVNPVNPFGPRKIIPPGQHGRNKSFKKKPYESCEYDYLIRLKLKQRLRFHYGLTEKQLVRYVQQAKKIKGSTGKVLLRLLEMRLDNIVFRLHMAPTIKAARQLISHGHILVNKKKVTIPSFQCQPKDIITVAPKIISMELVSRFLSEFDKEKLIYDRILKILEFGRKGVTMKTKNVSNKASLKKELLRKGKNSRSFGNTAKIQKLKIGTVLNVKIQSRGRKDAEAISYAFGKMIVIHPFFVGKQSINKNVRVVIYKKSKNNKILYAYPANPFYLRLENLRKLNSLDVAKLFNNSLNQISYKFNKKSKSSVVTDKKLLNSRIKINTSALILMNASKLLSKTSSDRRKRVITGQQGPLENNTLTNERNLVPSVFIRIVAAKCLSKSKQNSSNLSSFLNSLKRVNPTFSKDPVAYREKYVYTKTSKVLRLFGTRFYAKILKNKKTDSNFNSKKSNFGLNKTIDKRTVRKNVSNNENSFASSKGFQMTRSNSSVSVNFENKSKSVNVLPFALKSASSQATVNQNFSNKASFNKTTDANTQNTLQIGLFNKYRNLFSKLGFLKAQKNIQNVDFTTLKKKVLNTFLFESKKLSLKSANIDNFIVLFFQKLSYSLEQKNNVNFTKENILFISKNLNNFWSANNTEYLESTVLKNSKQFSNEMIIFLLKLTSINKNLSNSNSQLIDTKINNLIETNINFLFLVDQIKNKLQNNFNFIKSFSSSDSLINSILPYFNNSSIYSVLNKLDNLSLSICNKLLNLVNTKLNLVKLTKIKDSVPIQSFDDLIQNLVTFNQTSFKFNLFNFVNVAMVSFPNAVFLVEYERSLKGLDSTKSSNITESLDSLKFNSLQKQKVILVKTLNFLKQKNLVIDVDNCKKVIKEVIQNQTEVLSYLKNELLLSNKFNQFDTFDHNLNVDLRSKLQEKVLATTMNQKLVLLDQFSNSHNNARSQTKISLDILQRKNNILKLIYLMKDFHLIKLNDFTSVHRLLKNQFSLVEKLQGMLTTINFENSVTIKNKIQTVLTKNFDKIDQILASKISFYKLFNNKLQIADNSLAKQTIFKNIIVFKTMFSQTLLQNFLSQTDLAVFVKNSLFKTMKNFKFVIQLHKIMNITVLKEVNILSANCVAQMYADVKEKLALKGLIKVNTILSKLVLDSKLHKVNINNKIDLLALDSFLKTSFLNASITKGQKIVTKDYFWKKVLSVLTPNKIAVALKTLKDLNTLSSQKYESLLLKLNNLSNLNKTLNLSLNKQYFMEKLNIIFETLVLISENVKLQTLMSLNIISNTNWGANTISNLGLQKQNELRDILEIVNVLKTKLLGNLKLQDYSAINSNQVGQLNSLTRVYIENQYGNLINNFLSLDLGSLNNQTLINSYVNSITNNIKVFLKLQTFVLESSKQVTQPSIISQKNSVLYYLNKELKNRLVTVVKNKQNLLTDMEYKQLKNTFKKVTGSSIAVKLSLNFNDNFIQNNNNIIENTFILNKLQKNILGVYNSSFTPDYYSFQSSFNSSFETSSVKSNKVFLYKILNNLKLTVNNSKLSNLIGDLANNEVLQLKSKATMYQTFTNLALIENYVLVNKDYNFKVNNKQVLQSAKALYLKQFNQNLKFLIYLNNLDKLKNTDIISEQQYAEFKVNYENIFKLVRKQLVLLNVLNKRKKWNFINYGTYQNLVRSIYKNLTVKITVLLQKPTLNSLDLSTNEVSKAIGGSAKDFEVNALVQQTLERLVNVSDSSLNNVSTLVSNFVSKTLLVSQEPMSRNLQIKNTAAQTALKPLVKETYKRLIAIQKTLDLAGPGTVDSALRKTKQKQKTLILQRFINNVKISDGKNSSPNMYNKFVKISLFPNFSQEKTKFLFNNISLTTDSKQISTSLNKSNILLKVVENLQFKLQKDYLTKFSNGLLNVDILNSTLNLNLNNFKEFMNFSNVNIQNQPSLKPAVQIYNNKFVFQSIYKHLENIYTNQKFNIEFKQIYKFQKVQLIKTILFNYAFQQTNIKNSVSKILLSKLLTESLTSKAVDNSQNFSQIFINSSNIEKLITFEASLKSSDSVAKVSNNKIARLQKDIQNYKLRKTILSLKHFESIFSNIQGFSFTSLKHSTILLDVLSKLYDLKNHNIISERKYSLIKQKLKIFSLFLVLNEKLISLKTEGLINSEKAVELQKQIIQKINQKIKKVKTFSKFKYSLNSLNQLTKKGSSTNNKRKTSAITSLNSGGRWAKVTLKQLVKQKLLNNRQEEKLTMVLSNQDNNKIKKLRRIISVLLYSRQILENSTNSNNEKLITAVINSTLQDFNGPWKRVLINLLTNQNFKDTSSTLNLQSNLVTNGNSNSQVEMSSSNSSNFEYMHTQIKVTKLLRIYYNQILILRRLKTNRTIPLLEFEQKLKNILGNIIMLLDKGGLEAFKVIYNTKWVNVLVKNTDSRSSVLNSNAKNMKVKAQKTKTKRNLSGQSTVISEFSSKYTFYKNLYFSLYKKSVLKNKIKVFHLYKKNLLTELLSLENLVSSEQTISNASEVLNTSRLNYLKKQGIVDSHTKTYKKLTVMLATSLQRLAKLDRLFKLQNLYMYTSTVKNTTENTNYTPPLSELTSSPELSERLNNNSLTVPFIKLKQKIIQAYLRFEYKQIEKSLMKQKLFVKNLNSNLSKKRKNLKGKLVTRIKSKGFSAEQFNSFFQQLLNFLDSRYKSGGRNRRNPRINSIIRRLNQKLAFDKTLTKKFGDHLQNFIEKRFGPALPIPPHLELKRWKIKNAKLQSKQKSNLKFLILPVGVVHDLAPRRSVGLPILERLIVEYYSRN
uniref:Small ribosomal subunit protein uS4c n=1 Tax=Uronema confervicola TaxID=764120 RepID=A0A6H1U5Q9_9CHLO|nr:ribosomal protein S4 [Uronema confervicola]QIZ74181.1 ribosomal protein S4 [Uronema confervicola]